MSNSFVPIHTKNQHEALLNELKGNIFEFIIAQQLAQRYGVEAKFLHGFGGEFKGQLLEYQKWILEHRPELLKRIPLLAKSTLDQTFSKLPQGIEDIKLVGKYAATGSGKEVWHETDLVLLASGETYPLSIKLCKGHAYVNTKSGGVKSFISKYFAVFKNSKIWQEKLSKVCDQSFSTMAARLYEQESLPYVDGFDESWHAKGLPVLPGELSNHLNEIVVQSYYEQIAVLYEALRSFYEEDQSLFATCLLPLMGMGDESMMQLVCFHKTLKGDSYCFDRALFHSYEQVQKELEAMELKELKDKVSSFELEFSTMLLQIRVKPMNKFTTNGIKINCSVKYK